MTAIDTRNVTMFEECGMTPEEIAAEYGLEVSAIKAQLLAHSKIFRAQHKESSSGDAAEEEADVTKEEIQEFIAMYKHIARTTDDEHLRERTLRNLINEGKGRNDIINVAKNMPTVNVVVLNDALLEARRAIERGRQKPRELNKVQDIIEIKEGKAA